MKRITAPVAVLILLSLLMTGCWSRRELNDLSIVTGIGIDKDGEHYLLSVQIVNPGQVTGRGASSGTASVTTYKITSATMYEGVRRLTTVTPRKLYFPHVRVIVVSEEVAKDGVRDVLDLFFRDHEMRPDFYMVLTKGTRALDVLSFFSPLEKFPTMAINRIMETSDKNWAPTISVRLDQFISDLLTEGKEPVVTSIRVNGDIEKGETEDNLKKIQPYATLQLSSKGVFKADKLIGWLTEEESKGYNYLTNHVTTTVDSFACGKNGSFDINFVRTRTRMEAVMRNGKPEIDVRTFTEGNVGEVQCQLDLTDPETIARLEKLTEQALAKSVETTVKQVQERFKVDIYGFGKAIHHKYPAYWNKVRGEWDREFETIKVNPTFRVEIRRSGKVSNSFSEKMKEVER
ncbi:Ger(x)C family spore germination protein [Paenibacillus sp. MBLB4367]|uniref:Ger(x)C family spore germination protein n=1 Tax=Paenibacillus sp. MBLB4367 TaxID=3384767 RepID=UPI0039080C99